MKNWLKIASGAMMTVALSVSAQSVDQRKTLRQSVDVTELSTLADKYQKKFEADEAKVLAYLLANPTLKRDDVVKGVGRSIVRIDNDGNPVYRVARGTVDGQKNRASGILIKTDSLYPGGSIGVNITGTGMLAGVWEPGVLPVDGSGAVSHDLLIGKATNQDPQPTTTVAGNANHAAHVTGTIVGSDIASRPSARGIAYGATSKNWDAANDLAEMTAAAATGLLVSNHSYGDANTQSTNLWKYGAYDTEAKDWDAMLKAAPNYLPFVAAGNEQTSSGNFAAKAGYDIMTGPAASKNTMVVGAVGVIVAGGPNDDKAMSAYSNWGPTDDGRVKPDIVAKGTGIDSAQAINATTGALTNSAYSGNGDDSSGTSYASPAAAAAGLLLQQYYSTLTGGAFMRSSTLKALMLGTAEDLGNPGPDHKFGWGLLNIEQAAQAIKKRTSLTAPATLANSRGSRIEEIAVNPAADSTTEITRRVYAKGGQPLVVNIGWIDDEGPEQLASEGVDPTTSRMVYEFDVMVRQVAPNPLVETWPWIVPSMLNRTANATIATAWFQSNGGNFRQVIIANPIANAEYTIVIRKKTGSPAADRSLSLVAFGLAETAPGLPVDGACGSANGTPSLVAPSANLCSAGTASTVTSGTNSFTWTCNSDNGGANASCAAPHQYTVTATAGANGTLSCNSPVTGGNTTTCIASPAAGFNTQSISGCSGVATGLEVNSYTTGAVTADCTVTAAFVAAAANDGHCGSANGVATTVAPSGASLCSVGNASAVASGVASFSWSCASVSAGATSTCAAPRQYTVTTSAGANGTLNCANPVTSGRTTTCTATPSAGFTTQSISGCSGVASSSGVNSYSTGAVAADCTVSATFVAVVVPVNGACGSANGVASFVAPSSNLCGAGTATAVSSADDRFFAWSCNGSNGGTTASCSAPHQYTVTASAGANGTLSCASPVNGGATTTCSAVPSSGYVTQRMSGCSGNPTASGVNNYTTGIVIVNCTVSASFVAMGSLTVTGTASPLTGGSVTCTPTTVPNGGNASCTAAANAGFTFTTFSGDCTGATCNMTNITANKAVVAGFAAVRAFAGTTATASGAASMSFTGGGNTCRVDSGNTAFVAAGATNATGTFPHGWLRLRLVGCDAASTVRVSITWPSLTGTYLKYGRTPTSAGASVFYTPTNLTVSGNTVSFDVKDGGLGDSDLDADGVITDPSGPLQITPVATPVVPVPTLSELALALLGLLMATVTFANRKRLVRLTA